MNLFQIITPWYPFTAATTTYRSVWSRILSKVLSQVIGLGLMGIDTANISIQKTPFTRDWTNPGSGKTYPGIIICPWGSETMNPTQGVNRRDDVEYPVLISIFTNDNEDLVNNIDRYLLWREKIARHFRNQKLSGIPEIIKTIPRPLPVYLPEPFQRGVWHSAMVFGFVSREVRGDS